MHLKFLKSYFPHVVILKESLDCQKCRMVEKTIYLAHLKCCTYHPFLPNYSVGAILNDNKQGAKILKKKIARREFTLPLGMMPSWHYRQKHKYKEGSDFGCMDDLLCPFFNSLSGGCHIWQQRSSACAAFHCESDRGDKGRDYWQQFNEAFYYVEMALSQDFLLHLGYDWEEVEEQLSYLENSAHNVDSLKALSFKSYRRLWRHYAGREKVFYEECFEYLLSLDVQGVSQILGLEGVCKVNSLNIL